MRVVWWTEAGPPEVLVPGEAPDPVPGPGQLLVSVEISGISFIETMIRAGRMPRQGVVPPAVLGNAVGGTVAATGPRVDGRWLGRRVVSGTGGAGGYAELALAAEADAVEVPEGLDLPSAVALLADGRTGLGLHRVAGPRAGETVLVEAAAGGLGTVLVQLAVAAGARVIGAVSSEPKARLVRDLGAEPLDYTAAGWTDRLPPDGLDVGYDGVGGPIGAAVLAAMRPGGRFLVHGLASGGLTDVSAPPEGVVVHGIGTLGEIGVRAHELSVAALAEAAAGRLRAIVGQTYPLAEASRAHAALDAREALGKTLLTVR